MKIHSSIDRPITEKRKKERKKEMEREENSKEVEAENAISSLPLLLPRNAN